MMVWSADYQNGLIWLELAYDIKPIFAAANGCTESGCPVLTELPTVTDSEIPHMAAIDMGSNSFHMVIARTESGEIRPVQKIAEKVMLQFVRSDYEPVLPVHNSFIMHYAFGDMGELEEAMRRAFYDHFKKDIKVSEEIGIMLPSTFDDKEFEDLTIEEIADGPPEYGEWNGRNL